MLSEGHPRECFTVDQESGRLGFLLFYGVVGTVLTLVLAEGVWIPSILVAGALVGGVMAWRMYGYSHIWLEEGSIVQRTPHKLKRIRLDTVVEMRVTFIPNLGDQLLIKNADNDFIEITQLNEATHGLRHELGRRLKGSRVHAYDEAQRTPRTMQTLGLR